MGRTPAPDTLVALLISVRRSIRLHQPKHFRIVTRKDRLQRRIVQVPRNQLAQNVAEFGPYNSTSARDYFPVLAYRLGFSFTISRRELYVVAAFPSTLRACSLTLVSMIPNAHDRRHGHCVPMQAGFAHGARLFRSTGADKWIAGNCLRATRNICTE